MSSQFSEDIKARFRSNNPLTRLILINVVIFVVLGLLRIFTFLSGEAGPMVATESFLFRNLALPLSFSGLLHHPWTLISYMFTQQGIFHLFWNMVNLFWFGQILADFTHARKLSPIYLLGGIAGGLIAILFVTIVPAFAGVQGAPLIGASAGVTAIIVAAAALVPNYSMNLMFIGEVKLIYVAAAVIFIDVLDVASYANIGGNMAHLGGALFGYCYIILYKRGTDLTKPLLAFSDRISGLFSGKPTMKVVHSRPMTDEAYNTQKVANQQQVDAILDKISRSGYESLTKAEKEILFKASKK